METDEESVKSCWDDGSSITSVTTLTVTEGISQPSRMSSNRRQNSNKSSLNRLNLLDLTGKLSSNLVEMQKSLHGNVTAKQNIRTSLNLVNLMESKVTTAIEFDNLENEELKKSLKTTITNLEIENYELKKSIKKQNEIKLANDALNEYIDQSEEYHNREIASLKAQLSLYTITDEIKNSSKLLSTSNFNKSFSSDGEITKEKKKRRSSSLKFWKRSADDLSNSSNGINNPVSNEDILSLVRDTAENTISEKCSEIEILRSENSDLERHIELLEKNIRAKEIQITKTENRNEELIKINRHIKQQESECSDVINNLARKARHAIARAIASSRMTEEMRGYVQLQYDNLSRIEENLTQLSIENKGLMTRLNQSFYDKKCLNDEKTKLANFISTFLLNEDFNCSEVSTDELIQKTKNTLLEKQTNKEDKYTQTKNKKENKNKSNPMRRRDSGVSLVDKVNDADSVCNSSPCHCFDCEESIHRSYMQWLSFLQNNMNTEIEKYKSNMTDLENENVSLRESLNRYERIHFDTKFQRRRDRARRENRPREKTIRKSEQSFDTYMLCGLDTNNDIQLNMDGEITPDNNLFLHSYEQGSAIIRNIIEQKNKLERSRNSTY